MKSFAFWKKMAVCVLITMGSQSVVLAAIDQGARVEFLADEGNDDHGFGGG